MRATARKRPSNPPSGFPRLALEVISPGPLVVIEILD
jgi:hypothetical protein